MKVMKTIKAGKFDGFAAFIRLKWTGTEFVRSEAE